MRTEATHLSSLILSLSFPSLSFIWLSFEGLEPVLSGEPQAPSSLGGLQLPHPDSPTSSSYSRITLGISFSSHQSGETYTLGLGFV